MNINIMNVGTAVVDKIKNESHILFDMLAFERHVRNIRDRKDVPFPDAWYDNFYFYPLPIEPRKIKGTGETIYFPSFVKKPDYEVELAGMLLDDILTTDEKEAVRFVREKMIFTIFNDTSCRDIQENIDMKVPLSITRSKMIADKAFGPVWVRGKDLKMDDRGVFNICVCLFVNGEKRLARNFNTIYFVHPKTGGWTLWGFAQTIAAFGGFDIGLRKGQMLGSGTIGGGSIYEFAPKIRDGIEVEPAKYEWLKEGDKIRIEVEGIGSLENTVGIKTF